MALKPCKECKKEVSVSAKVCPNCGVKDPGITTKDYLLGAAVLIFVVWVVGQFISDSDDSEAEVSSYNRCEDKGSAYVYAKSFVEKELYAPATADFPAAFRVEIQSSEGCRHRISGYVDSHNLFGATVRTSYVADIRYDESLPGYRLEKLNLQ